MKLEEMRTMEVGALKSEADKLRKELLETRCKVSLGEDVRPHKIKEIRREVARILTVIGEKEGAKS